MKGMRIMKGKKEKGEHLGDDGWTILDSRDWRTRLANGLPLANKKNYL